MKPSGQILIMLLCEDLRVKGTDKTELRLQSFPYLMHCFGCHGHDMCDEVKEEYNGRDQVTDAKSWAVLIDLPNPHLLYVYKIRKH